MVFRNVPDGPTGAIGARVVPLVETEFEHTNESVLVGKLGIWDVKDLSVKINHVLMWWENY